MRKHTYKVPADYYQFYVFDSGREPFAAKYSWDEEDSRRMLIVEPGLLGIGTARNFAVHVSIEVVPKRPEIHWKTANRVVETFIDVPTGRLVIAGCTESEKQYRYISVPSSGYRALVVYENLESAWLFGLLRRDRYRLVLWPGHECETKVIKQSKLRMQS